MYEKTGVQLIGTTGLCIQYFVATEIHVRYTEERERERERESSGGAEPAIYSNIVQEAASVSPMSTPDLP